MNAYPIFWHNPDNFIGIVTSESELTTEEVLKVFRQHYSEYKNDEGLYTVIDKVRHVHSI